MLTLKMQDERIKILKDNEEHLAEGPAVEGSESDEEEDGMQGGESDEDEKEYHDTLNKLQKLKQQEDKEAKEGKKKFKDAEIDDDEDDSEDSDYEYTGGDLALYDSALDDIDELIAVKETLQKISQVDMNYYQRLMSAMNQEELAKFNETMQNAESLKQREEVVRKQIDEFELKQKK